MGRVLFPDTPLPQGLAHQTDLAVHQIAQATMNEFGRPGCRGVGKVILLQ